MKLIKVMHSFRTCQTPMFDEGSYRLSAGRTQRTTVVGQRSCVLCVPLQLYRSVEEMWSGGIQEYVCSLAPPPLPWLISHTPPQVNLYSPPSKRKGPSWPFIFQFRAFLFLQINALQSTLTDVTLHHFHYDPQPLILPLAIRSRHQGRPSLDNILTWMIILGASLVLLSAETLAGRCAHKHSLPCPLQECGYRLVSGSGNDNGTTHSVVVTGHPETVQYLWQRFYAVLNLFTVAADISVPHLVSPL